VTADTDTGKGKLPNTSNSRFSSYNQLQNQKTNFWRRQKTDDTWPEIYSSDAMNNNSDWTPVN
jgi:hypothetical protein